MFRKSSAQDKEVVPTPYFTPTASSVPAKMPTLSIQPRATIPLLSLPATTSSDESKKVPLSARLGAGKADKEWVKDPFPTHGRRCFTLGAAAGSGLLLYADTNERSLRDESEQQANNIPDAKLPTTAFSILKS